MLISERDDDDDDVKVFLLGCCCCCCCYCCCCCGGGYGTRDVLSLHFLFQLVLLWNIKLNLVHHCYVCRVLITCLSKRQPVVQLCFCNNSKLNQPDMSASDRFSLVNRVPADQENRFLHQQARFCNNIAGLPVKNLKLKLSLKV